MPDERVIPEPEPTELEPTATPEGEGGSALDEFKALLEEAREEEEKEAGGAPGAQEAPEPGEPEVELAEAIWRQVSRTGGAIDPVFELSPQEIKDLAGPTARVLKKYEVMIGGAGTSMPPELALAIAMLMVYGPRVFVYIQNRRNDAKRDSSGAREERVGENDLDKEKSTSPFETQG